MKGAKGSQHQARSWGTVSDNIYFYTKSDDYRLQPLRKLTEDEILEEFKLKDDEISDVDWFSREQALEQAVSWFDATAISQLLK